MKINPCWVVLLLSSIASAQMSIDEARARLEARQKHPTTQTAAASAPLPKQPATKPLQKKMVYRAKPGAPYAIQQWVAMQPYVRKLRLEEMKGAIARKKREIDAHSKSTISRIHYDGTDSGNLHGVGAHDEIDRGAEKEWKDKLTSLRQELASMILEEKKFEADDQPHLYYDPALSFKVGSVGNLGGFKVTQVVNDHEMLVEKGDQAIWLKGFDTTGVVDDQRMEDNEGVIISGTKQYTTVLGASRTVFMAEPFKINEWIELVEDDGTVATTQPSPDQKATAAKPAVADLSKIVVGMTESQIDQRLAGWTKERAGSQTRYANPITRASVSVTFDRDSHIATAVRTRD